MRRYGLLILFGLASLYALWRGIRLAFFPVAMQSTVSPDTGREVVGPAFVPGGGFVLVLVVILYAFLGYALSIRYYTVFRLIAGVHIALSLFSLASYGILFLPSSALLLLAILLSLGSRTPQSTWAGS
jgi:hypothetical protein